MEVNTGFWKKPSDLKKARLGVTYRELYYTLESAADEAMSMGNKKLQNQLKKEADEYYRLQKKLLATVTQASIDVATVEQTLRELNNLTDEERTRSFPNLLPPQLIKKLKKLSKETSTLFRRTYRVEPDLESALETWAAALNKRNLESKRDL